MIIFQWNLNELSYIIMHVYMYLYKISIKIIVRKTASPSHNDGTINYSMYSVTQTHFSVQYFFPPLTFLVFTTDNNVWGR